MVRLHAADSVKLQACRPKPAFKVNKSAKHDHQSLFALVFVSIFLTFRISPYRFPIESIHSIVVERSDYRPPADQQKHNLCYWRRCQIRELNLLIYKKVGVKAN